MSAAVGDLVTVSTDAAIFLDYPKFKSFHLFSLIRILGGELKLAVWMQRNSKKYDKANITDRHPTIICSFRASSYPCRFR